MRTACLPLAAIILAVAAPAFAENGKFLGNFKTWEANTSKVGGGRVCFLSSLPKKSEGKYKKRGEVSVIVTHWPGRKRFHEVSVVAGYTYKKDSKLEMLIDGARFDLYTDADRAWRYSSREDRELTQAMRKGTTMVVTGVSARGTKTIDTYSLSGFTAAHNAINKACGAK